MSDRIKGQADALAGRKAAVLATDGSSRRGVRRGGMGATPRHQTVIGPSVAAARSVA